MFETGAEKANQPAAKRCDIDVAVPQVQAQLAFIGRQPSFIQIEHAGQQAAAIPCELVQVSAVCAASAIAGKVAVELEQAQLQLAVQCQSQLFEARQAIPLGMGGTLFFQP